MNWGYKIVFGLGAFMAFIVAAGIYMVSHDTDSLVESDYYEKSLSYDETVHKKENLMKYQAKPTVLVKSDTLVLHFKQAGNQGVLLFKRADENKGDKEIPFATNNTTFKLPLTSFKAGSWNLDIDWKHEQASYLSNHQLFIPSK